MRLLKYARQVHRSLESIPGYKALYGRIAYETLGDRQQKTRPERTYLQAAHSQPVDANSILLESYWGRKAACNPLALYRSLITDSRFADMRFIWVANDPSCVPDDVLRSDRVKFIKHATADYGHALATSGVVVSNMTFPPYFRKRSGQYYINTWHGVPIKVMGYDIPGPVRSIANTVRNFLQADIVVSAGPYFTRQMTTAYGLSRLAHKFVEIGSPRVDLGHDIDKSVLRRRLGARDEQKIIVYAPTWRTSRSSAGAAIERMASVVNGLKRRLGDRAIVRLSTHHMARVAARGHPVLEDLLPDEYDINEVLAATDVLISDYSSVVLDHAALLGKVILFTPDRDQYASERGLYIDEEELPFSTCADQRSLEETVSRLIDAPDASEASRAVREAYMPLEDGQATSRLASLIHDRQQKRGRPPPAGRPRMLFYPGGMQLNGISICALALLQRIDKSQVDVFVLVSASSLDRNTELAKRLMGIPGITLLPTLGTATYNTTAPGIARHILRHPRAAFRRREAEIDKVYGAEARRMLGDLTFDVIVDFAGYSPYWSLMLTKVPAKRRLIFQHADLSAELNNRRKDHRQLRAVFETYRYYDQVVSVGEGLAATNGRNLATYLPGGRIPSVVRNVVEVPPQWRKQTPSPRHDGSPLFITIGRLSPEKNHDRLIRAFARLVQSGKEARLMIVGGGVLNEDLQSLAKDLSVQDRVIFTGPVHNPLRFLSLADCFVLSSDYEGLPTVLIEAMALGKPIVATDMPATVEVLQYGSGMLVPPTVDGVLDGMNAFLDGAIGALPFDLEAYNNAALHSFYAATGLPGASV